MNVWLFVAAVALIVGVGFATDCGARPTTLSLIGLLVLILVVPLIALGVGHRFG